MSVNNNRKFIGKDLLQKFTKYTEININECNGV